MTNQREAHLQTIHEQGISFAIWWIKQVSSEICVNNQHSEFHNKIKDTIISHDLIWNKWAYIEWLDLQHIFKEEVRRKARIGQLSTNKFYLLGLCNNPQIIIALYRILQEFFWNVHSEDHMSLNNEELDHYRAHLNTHVSYIIYHAFSSILWLYNALYLEDIINFSHIQGIIPLGRASELRNYITKLSTEVFP